MQRLLANCQVKHATATCFRPCPCPGERGERTEGTAVRLRTGSMHRISYLPSPMAAQVISVIMTREQLWQRWALGFLCLRSQQRVSRYSSSPSSERISMPAGMEASMPRLWKRERERKGEMISYWLSITDWFIFVQQMNLCKLGIWCYR